MQGYTITGNKNNEINESKLISKLLNKSSVPLSEQRELLVYCVSVSEGYFQAGSFERVSDFIYGRAVVCEGSPLSIVIFFCLCEGGAVLFGR